MTNLKELASKLSEIQAFDSKQKNTWCSGCGNFGIQNALKRALSLENIDHDKILMCYDVGCNGNESDKFEAYTIHGLHGRVIPLAAGACLTNPELKVIAQAGDGATFSEGINHLIHGIRNNYNLTFICHNNQNYGLTIGQASSTTRQGVKMSASPEGVSVAPLNSLDLVLSSNPSFVARSFSGDIGHMTEMIRLALNHKGFSYLEILQACPTFNKDTPQEWYWDKLKYLSSDNHNPLDLKQARQVVMNFETQIAVGLIFHNPDKPDFYGSINPYKDNSTGRDVFSKEIGHLLKAFT